MPTVSVIMAVHNARDTIVQAVDSVLDQSFEDFELLLVDDASTDDSVAVARSRLLERGGDERVRFLSHPTNRRAAAARNTGVDAASGTFVSFVDSDDEYLPTYLETLVGAVGPDVDIVVGNVVYVRPDGSQQERRPAMTGDFSGGEACRLGLFDKITPFTCDKLIRRSLYEGVRYPEGIINEDFLTNPVLAAAATTVRVLDEPVYLYKVRAGSVTWGTTPPASDLDAAEAYLRSALRDGPSPADETDLAITHAMVFLTLSTAQRALIKTPRTVHDAEVVRDCRRRLRITTLLRLLRPAPVIACGAALLKLAPPAYAWLYRRHVRSTFG